MDSYAIATAIASRFKAATPPSGLEAVKVATPDLPGNVSVFPTVLVLPPELDNASYNASRNRSYDLTYPVLLVLSRADGTPRRAKAVHDWATKMYGQLGGQMQLGLPAYVALSYLVGFTAGAVSYGGEDFDGIRFDVVVRVSESYTPVA